MALMSLSNFYANWLGISINSAFPYKYWLNLIVSASMLACILNRLFVQSTEHLPYNLLATSNLISPHGQVNQRCVGNRQGAGRTIQQ